MYHDQFVKLRAEFQTTPTSRRMKVMSNHSSNHNGQNDHLPLTDKTGPRRVRGELNTADHNCVLGVGTKALNFFSVLGSSREFLWPVFSVSAAPSAFQSFQFQP